MPLLCFVSISMLVACSDGSSTGESSPPHTTNTDSESPTGRVIFPPAQSITEATYIEVRGTATDNQDLGFVTVNDIVAFSQDGYATWQARVPLENGLNTLSVVVTDFAGNTNINAINVDVRREVIMSTPNAITINKQTNEALITDDSTIVSINLDSGERSTIAQPPFASLSHMTDIDIDTVNQKVYTSDSRIPRIFEVNLISGKQRVIATDDSDPNLTLSLNEDLEIDTANNRALSIDIFGRRVVSVDLSNETKSVTFENSVSSPSIGTVVGADYDSTTNSLFITDLKFSPQRIGLLKIDLNTNNSSRIVDYGITVPSLYELHLDLANNRAFSVRNNTQKDSIVSIDLTTGDLSELSNADVSSNDLLSNFVQTLTFDDENNRLLVLDSSTEALILINTENGEQSVLTNSHQTTPNDDNRLDASTDIALDKTNNRVLAIDERLGLISVDIATGQRTILSDTRDVDLDMGVGFSLISKPVDLEYDENNNRALVLDQKRRSVIAIDLASGQRTSLYDGSFTDSANLLDSPISMAFDSETDIVYIEDHGSKNIVAIDLNTGIQTLIAQYENIKKTASADLVLDKANNRIYLGALDGNNKILSIDLQGSMVQQITEPSGLNEIALDLNNDRAIILGEDISGSGGKLYFQDLRTQELVEIVTPSITSEDFVRGNALAVDIENDRIFMLNKRLGAIYHIDLTLRQAVIISS